MTDLTKLKAQLEQMKEVRAKASLGVWKWDERNSELFGGDGYLLHTHCLLGELFRKDSGEFVALAANNWLSLIEKLELAVQTLEKITLPRSMYFENPRQLAEETLQKIARVE